MAAAMLTRRDIDALKEYVSAPGNFGQNQAESTVRLHVTHSNLKAEFIELRLDLHVSLSNTQTAWQPFPVDPAPPRNPHLS